MSTGQSFEVTTSTESTVIAVSFTRQGFTSMSSSSPAVFGGVSTRGLREATGLRAGSPHGPGETLRSDRPGRVLGLVSRLPRAKDMSTALEPKVIPGGGNG